MANLNVQEYLLSGKSLENLKDEFGICFKFHPEMDKYPLVILDYDQINSRPRNHPLVKECRGLVLEHGTWNLVAKAFDRFFNIEEYPEEVADFDWSSCTATDKEDGSLIMCFWYKDRYHVKTRFGWAQDNPSDGPFSWEELFWQAMPADICRGEPPEKDRLGVTHVFELCTPYNQIVRYYDKPVAFWLSDIVTKQDYGPLNADIPIPYEQPVIYRRLAGGYCGFTLPRLHEFRSAEEVAKFIEGETAKDLTFEGVVLRDKNNRRIKAKSAEYVRLHSLRGNPMGGNLCSPSKLVLFCLKEDPSEILSYFPDVEPYYNECKRKVDAAFDELRVLWNAYKDLENQKEFALSINHHPLKGILFNTRKRNVPLRDVFVESEDLLIKVLFNGV
jgi:hypothetical protein